MCNRQYWFERDSVIWWPSAQMKLNVWPVVHGARWQDADEYEFNI